MDVDPRYIKHMADRRPDDEDEKVPEGKFLTSSNRAQINPKRQRASPSVSHADDDSEDLLVLAKDSQDEIQDSGGYHVEEPAAGKIRSGETAGDDGGSQNHEFEALDSQDSIPRIHASRENRPDRVSIAEQVEELPLEKACSDLLARTRWRNTVPNAESRSIPLALRLQELTGEVIYNDTSPSARLPDDELHRESRGIPLALRLQELTGEVTDNSTCPRARLPDNEMDLDSRGIPLALRFQELTGEVASSDVRPSARFPNNELDLESRGIPLALRFQELVQQGIQNDGVEDSLSEDLELQMAPSKEKSRSAAEDEIEESLLNDEDLQRSPSKVFSEIDFGSTSLLLDRFREALESAPLDSDSTVVARHNSKLATSGFSAALQNVVKRLRSRQMRFEKAAVQGKPLHGKSLHVLILRKRLKAQLTICQCAVLQSPEEADDFSFVDITDREVATSNTAQVIFSSKISPNLEVEIGGTIRIDPPWREIQGPGTIGKIISNTYFCETVKLRDEEFNTNM